MTTRDLFGAEIVSVDVRLATEEDKTLPAYDNTTLTAVNTCPTWGIVRHVYKKRMSSNSRAMALEAGSASHDVFAAVRLHQLIYTQERPDLAAVHGARIFGQERWDNMHSLLEASEDDSTRRVNFCLEALHTSGYYDDPQDRFRTIANIEESCLAYIDRWDNKEPVWIGSNPNLYGLGIPAVGIEIPFEMVITYLLELGDKVGNRWQKSYRFIGRIDGIHVRKIHDAKSTHPLHLLHENKTGARLNEAWTMQWAMSHQVTGYCLAASLFIGKPVNDGFVLGMQIPLPKSAYDYGGIVREYFERPRWQTAQWFEWFLHTVQTIERFQGKDDIDSAPRFTHSCSRYFRPCAMLPYCTSESEERIEMIAEMVDDLWSPLNDV